MEAAVTELRAILSRIDYFIAGDEKEMLGCEERMQELRASLVKNAERRSDIEAAIARLSD